MYQPLPLAGNRSGWGYLVYFNRTLSVFIAQTCPARKMVMTINGSPGEGGKEASSCWRRSLDAVKPILHVMKPSLCPCKNILSIADQPSSGERLAVRG